MTGGVRAPVLTKLIEPSEVGRYMPLQSGSETPEVPATATFCRWPLGSKMNWLRLKTVLARHRAGPLLLHSTPASAVLAPRLVLHGGGGPPEVPAVATVCTLPLGSMMK